MAVVRERDRPLSSMTADELRAARLRLGALSNSLHSRATLIGQMAQRYSDELAKREGNTFEITDHAVLQYLKRLRGLDVEAVRAEMRAMVEKAAPTAPLREAEAYVGDGIVFVVARGRIVVTVYPEQEADDIDPMIVATAIG